VSRPFAGGSHRSLLGQAFDFDTTKPRNLKVLARGPLNPAARWGKTVAPGKAEAP